MSEDEGHPLISGVLAMVGVCVVVGILVSGAALAATSVLGLGNDKASDTASSDVSMYLPRPTDTDLDNPSISLAPGESPSATDTESQAPQFPITLSAASPQVGPMEEIYLTGVYPTGEGAVVQVQRFENGKWDDFASVDAVVTGGQFSTYVQTAQTGVNRFRVRDTDSSAVSNEVRVKVQ